MDSFTAKLCVSVTMILAIATFTGCSTYFNSVRIPTSESATPFAGAPYSLPYTSYDIEVTRSLVGCWAWQGKGPDRKKVAGLVITSDVKATPVEKPDPTQSYVIDIGALGSMWKTTATEVKWNTETGNLESISASAEDKFGSTVVTIVTSLAKTIIAVGGPGTGGNDSEPTGACLPEIQLIVSGMKGKQEEIAKATAALDRDNKKLVNDNAAAKLLDKDITPAVKVALAELQQSVGKQVYDLSILQDAFDSNLKLLTYKDKVTWPPDGATFGELNISNKDASVAGMPVKAVEIVPALDADQLKKWGNAGNDIQKTRLLAKIVATSPLSVTNPCTTKCETDDIKGLKYRQKSAGYLLICQGADCVKDDTNAVGVAEGMISQLGRVYVVPLKSGVFSNKTLSATFDKVGQPTMIGLTSKSESDGAAITAASVLDQIGAARNAIIPSKVDRLKAQIDQLKLEKELADTLKALKPDPNEGLSTSTTAYAAEKANIDAKVALLNAQKTLDAMTKMP